MRVIFLFGSHFAVIISELLAGVGLHNATPSSHNVTLISVTVHNDPGVGTFV